MMHTAKRKHSCLNVYSVCHVQYVVCSIDVHALCHMYASCVELQHACHVSAFWHKQVLGSIADQLPDVQLPLLSEDCHICNCSKLNWEEAVDVTDQLAGQYSQEQQHWLSM